MPSVHALEQQLLALLSRWELELDCLLAAAAQQRQQGQQAMAWVLHTEELRAALEAFLSFSAATSWHMCVPGTSDGSRWLPPFAASWQTLASSGLLAGMAQALALLRVPRTAGQAASEGDKVRGGWGQGR